MKWRQNMQRLPLYEGSSFSSSVKAHEAAYPWFGLEFNCAFFFLLQTVEDKITTVVAAASQTAENDMDVDGEQQQASASVKRLKHIKDKVLTGRPASGCLGGRVIRQ